MYILPTHPRTRRSGFTLIELLIVVAIIAILAAIAVPNFLEAQVRSKVSRVKADMRTVATAMESYAVDYSNYPFTGGQVRLTTPISYISTYPNSPFIEVPPAVLSGMMANPRWEWQQGVRMTFLLTTETEDASGNVIFDPDPALGNPTFFCNNCNDRDFYVYSTSAANVAVSSLNSGILERFGQTTWNLKSFGPDEDDEVSTGSNAALYDPTNGTLSSGDILYFGSGFGFLDGR